MARSIDNTEDVIDSRDIIERIEELEAMELDSTWSTDSEEATERGLDDEEEELVNLRALAKDAADYAEDWQHGATLIRESYFVDYAQELAEDITGYDQSKASWPYTHIDWNAAADDLKQDYTEVEFNGVTYYVR